MRPGQLAIKGTCMPAGGRQSFAARVRLALELRRDSAARAVVAEEEDERVVANAQLVELRHEPADQLVHVGDHVGKVFRIVVAFVVLELWGPSRRCRASAGTGRA